MLFLGHPHTACSAGQWKIAIARGFSFLGTNRFGRSGRFL